jgi:hypothetical protein
MKDFIRMRLHEWGFDDIEPEVFVKAYTNKINELYDNLLVKGAKNQNYRFELSRDVKKISFGKPNRCETNAYNFVKEKLQNGEDFYYPVGGFAFQGQNFWPLEHWWVYDKQMNKFLEVTPVDNVFRCYAGIINTSIQDEILNSKNVFDIDFFKGGNVMKQYFK